MRALLGLVATAISAEPPRGLAEMLAETSPENLARVAQLNQVHTMIAPVLKAHPEAAGALPRDLLIFFETMHRANNARLASGIAQLTEIGLALREIEVPAVVLKGGADMLDALHEDQSIRFVGDLDILVPISRALEVERCLYDIGATAPFERLGTKPELNWRGRRIPEHHLPKLTRSDWHFPVELHTRTGPGLTDRMLAAESVISRRVPARVPGLSYPNWEDRACHLVVHAGRHSGQVSLRAWVDWVAMRKHCALSEVRSRLEAHDLHEAYAEFEHLADFLENALVISNNSSEKYSFVSSALKVLCAESKPRYFDLLRQVFRRARMLAESKDYRRYVARNVLDRRWWARVWSSHIGSRWRSH
ncbi:nucleotidyltransferase family protein [Leisingera sp. McT4-56]|uniref:nucleotidyltransferase family protein n=1 Tax=Leisingera sp. McT4-56 TaxID=2881255 RepID=UPI001CF8BFAE|nr:nucleotidyltransferase family protein [Leisingera sp. McT4-56]MCB4455966.1 nucleotidyltransferase family protein [Leisingera sp. McT4-56]